MSKVTPYQYMVGRLQGNLFAFPVLEVEGVSEFHEKNLTNLDSEFADGVMMYHFQRIPLLDTRKILGLDLPSKSGSSVSLVMKVSHGFVGIPLDDILFLVDANESNIRGIDNKFFAPEAPFIGVIQTESGNAIVVDVHKAASEEMLISVFNKIYVIKDSFATNFVFNLGVVEHMAKKKDIEMEHFIFDASRSREESALSMFMANLKFAWLYLAISLPRNMVRKLYLLMFT